MELAEKTPPLDANGQYHSSANDDYNHNNDYDDTSYDPEMSRWPHRVRLRVRGTDTTTGPLTTNLAVANIVYCFENPYVDPARSDRLDWELVSGANTWSWANNTTDPRALLTSSAMGAGRAGGEWYGYSGLVVDVNLTDDETHQVALYVLDWNNQGWVEQVDVVDPGTGLVLDSRTVSSFAGGQYLVYNVTGHVQFRVSSPTNLSVLNGIFFDGAPTHSATPVTFMGSDTSTQGNWVGSYGGQGYSVAGGETNLPSFASVTGYSGGWKAFRVFRRSNRRKPSGDLLHLRLFPSRRLLRTRREDHDGGRLAP